MLVATFVLAATACGELDLIDWQEVSDNRGCTIDTHVHLPDWKVGKERYLGAIPDALADIREQVAADLRFVITPTYYYHYNQVPTVAAFAAENQTLASELSSDRSMVGLCGVPIQLGHSVEIARHCLQTPGIVGLKLHRVELDAAAYSDYSATYKALPARFEQIFALAHQHRAVLLVHFGDPWARSLPSRYRGAPADTAGLIALATRYPQAKLVIAHSGMFSFIGLDGLAAIGRHFEAHPELPRNVFTEVSASFEMDGRQPYGNPEVAADHLAALRAFGLDYVLWGSDYVPEQRAPSLPESVDALAGLSATEVDQIRCGNARRLLPRTAN